MASQSLNNVISAEQLMLTKMDAIRNNVQQVAFVIKPNPIDTTGLNQPISFSQAITNVLDTVNRHQSIASQKMEAVDTGKSDDLTGAMIASQKASLSFNALMQVRNKVVTSFEDVMKMPV
ncbi:flagellar hook-basal body complex protein FliE [Vibrio metschnikovii]|uniref:flagellar hook-basal body complex protein FliE n=1 Tax=Vibrio metschnikovii TaxID=28172 RepID=UPI002975F6EA|nr:flagellar hook-basal body complex protein FliE [Vibrio metschnikovii]EKO3658507.1 flagellar hook-basal body complex protein FliE [Vibrio metschnikovii]